MPAGERLRVSVVLGADGELHLRAFCEDWQSEALHEWLELIEGVVDRMLSRVERGRPAVPAGEEP